MPRKIMNGLKVVKRDLKIIISLCWSKSMTHSSHLFCSYYNVLYCFGIEHFKQIFFFTFSEICQSTARRLIPLLPESLPWERLPVTRVVAGEALHPAKKLGSHIPPPRPAPHRSPHPRATHSLPVRPCTISMHRTRPSCPSRRVTLSCWRARSTATGTKACWTGAPATSPFPTSPSLFLYRQNKCAVKKMKSQLTLLNGFWGG